jgi:sialidase-1
LYRFDYDQDGEAQSVLLFANPHSQQGRTHHSIQVSFDEGKTWPKEYRLLLDEGRGAGYPSLSRIDSKHIGIVYEGSGSHLVFEKISIDELLSPKSKQARE